jgi:hypothetical protein
MNEPLCIDLPTRPLKIQVGIRDHWDKADSQLQVAIKQLHEVLGFEVVVDPEWQLLIVELDKQYADKTAFIPAVAGCVTVFCRSMTELLEDENNEEWTETLLEKVKNSYSRLRLFLEVCQDRLSECEGLGGVMGKCRMD